MNPSSHPTAVIAVINGTVYTEKVSHASTVSDCPLEQATRFMERFSGQPRAKWETNPSHHFNAAVLKIAKKLAGVDDTIKPYLGRGLGKSKPPRGKNTPLPFTEN